MADGNGSPGFLEGFLGSVGSRLRQLWRTDPSTPPVELAKGDIFPRGQPADLFSIYGYDTVVQYLKLDQDLLSRYVDYEEMDDYGEIASAIDIYADDCTQVDSQLKRVVWATAADRTVQTILDDLYHRTLQLDDEAWSIARTTVKYGNDYEELLVTDEGVKGLAYLPPATVRRIEGPKGQLFGFIQDFKGKFNFTPQDYLRLLRSRYGSAAGSDTSLIDTNKPETAESTPVLEDWEVCHFRLMSRQRRATYGTSPLDAARWIFKRLVLLEDTALIYRLNRAPERRAFYVDVGDLPPREALAYVNQVRQNHRKKKFFNPATGKLDIRYQAIGSDDDFYVPTRKGQDGSRIEILQSPSWQSMEDVEYFQDKLWAAIKIPKAYLGKEEGVVRSTLSSQDVRFARTVLRVQRALITGFHRIGRVHLAALRIPPDEVPFKVNMTVPSAIFELAQIEVMNARADLAGRMQTFVSGHWILSELFGLDEEAIKLIIQQRREEQLTQATNDATTQQILTPPPEAVPGVPPGQPSQATKRAPQNAGGGRPSNNILSSSRNRLSEREWFGGTRKDEAAARDKIRELLAHDDALSRRLGHVQGLLHDLSNRTKPQTR